MFLVSATGALWSGWLLLHGEDTDPILGALPAQCDAVVLLDKPAEAGNSLQRLADHPATPPQVAQLARLWAGPVGHSAGHPGLDTGQAWALCRRGPIWYAALATSADGGNSAVSWLNDVSSGFGAPVEGAWSERRGLQVQTASDGTVLAAVKRAPGLWIVAFRDPLLPGEVTPTADPARQLEALASETGSINLSKDKEFREAIERVGGGQARVFVRGETARRWLAQQLPEQGDLSPWRLGLPQLLWVSAALRDDGQAVHVQFHLGTAQKGVIFLKDHLDIQADQDMAPLLPAGLVAAGEAGVVRLPRRSWPMLTIKLAPSSALRDHFRDFGDRRDWNQWLAGPVAWLRPHSCLLSLAPLRPGARLPADAPLPQSDANCQLERRVMGPVLVTGTKTDLDAAASWLAEPKLQLPHAQPDADLARLARDTQGWTVWRSGQRGQLDWVWLDTGVAGALSVWPRSAP